MSFFKFAGTAALFLLGSAVLFAQNAHEAFYFRLIALQNKLLNKLPVTIQ